jgi:hypothetical protein
VTGARWVLWSKDVDPQVVDLYYSLTMRWIFVQGSTGRPPVDVPHRMCIAACRWPIHQLTSHKSIDCASLDMSMLEG